MTEEELEEVAKTMIAVYHDRSADAHDPDHSAWQKEVEREDCLKVANVIWGYGEESAAEWYMELVIMMFPELLVEADGDIGNLRLRHPDENKGTVQ